MSVPIYNYNDIHYKLCCNLQAFKDWQKINGLNENNKHIKCHTKTMIGDILLDLKLISNRSSFDLRKKDEKPYISLKDNKYISCSISHKNDNLLTAISLHNEVGVDIEIFKQMKPSIAMSIHNIEDKLLDSNLYNSSLLFSCKESVFKIINKNNIWLNDIAIIETQSKNLIAVFNDTICKGTYIIQGNLVISLFFKTNEVH